MSPAKTSEIALKRYSYKTGELLFSLFRTVFYREGSQKALCGFGVQ